MPVSKHPSQLLPEEVIKFKLYRSRKLVIGEPLESEIIYQPIGGIRTCLHCGEKTWTKHLRSCWVFLSFTFKRFFTWIVSPLAKHECSFDKTLILKYIKFNTFVKWKHRLCTALDNINSLKILLNIEYWSQKSLKQDWLNYWMDKSCILISSSLFLFLNWKRYEVGQMIRPGKMVFKIPKSTLSKLYGNRLIA